MCFFSNSAIISSIVEKDHLTQLYVIFNVLDMNNKTDFHFKSREITAHTQR